MNDLRSRSRALAAVPDEGSAPTSTPPRVRPETDEQSGRRMSRRQSIAERARRLEDDGVAAAAGGDLPGLADDHKFKSSRPQVSEELTASAQSEAAAVDETEPQGPSSRPSRRRDLDEEVESEEDRFPWHFQFDDDEPDELHASSPLLSRAFRSSIG